MRLASVGLVAGLLFTLVLAPAPARASTLIGSTAGIAVTGPDTTASPGSAVIGSGVEFQAKIGFVDFLAVDIGATAVTYTYGYTAGITVSFARSITLSGLTFTGPAAAITAIDVAVNDKITNVSATNFSFTSDSLTLNLGGVRGDSSWFVGGVITVTLNPGSAAVPEPATMALLGAGLLGLGMARRKRG